MNFNELKALDHEYTAQTYARFDVGILSGSGAKCKDVEGKEYIDFSSGVGVNSLGFCDAGWVAAVTEQLGTLQHTSNLYYNQPYALAAEAICTVSGMKKVFFANSGAEANEGAIKCARKYSRDKYGPGRHTIVTLVNSFHGRTMTTLSATGQDTFHKNFDPFPIGFEYAPAGDWDATKEKLGVGVCAVMIELIQGEGGVMPLGEEYVAALAKYCSDNDILLIVDEVQTGIGRTGALFAYMKYGIQPDIVTAAKGLGGGLPIGAVLFGGKTEGVLCAGDHASTFGANPAICAGMSYVLKKLDEKMLDEIRLKGEYIRERLLKMSHIAGVDGLGLMLGARLSDGVSARAVVEAGIARGVIALTAKEKLRLLPPLSITYEEIDEGLNKLNDALKAM